MSEEFIAARKAEVEKSKILLYIKGTKDMPQCGFSAAVIQIFNGIGKPFDTIDILVHSLANGPEVKNDLLETSRAGYLAAVSSSSYSFVSMLQHFGPYMSEGASTLSLTYLASEKARRPTIIQ